MTYYYNHSVLGGTFDRFHKGHRLFIDEAFKVSRKVTIGVAKESLTKGKKLSNVIQNLSSRVENVKNYLREQDYDKRSKIILIEDFYGNTLYEKNIDALFTDIKNIEKIDIINEERQKIGFPPIKSINVPVILDDHGIEISSTRIRKGKINREGKVYLDYFSKILVLPDHLRQSLREPFGELVTSYDTRVVNDYTFLIAVGDVVVSNLINNRFIPDISIFDLKTKKKKISDKKILDILPKHTIELRNNPGEIRSEVVKFIDKSFDQLIEKHEIVAIKIIGEEDLLALPSIILAPLGSIVMYGLRDEGGVAVRVTEEIKSKIVDLYISKFIS